MNTEISGASARQPLARASRPHTSPLSPRSTSRTYPHAARTGRLDSAMGGALTRRIARKRACDSRKQHTLSNGHAHGGFTAPKRSPITVSVTPAVAPMRLVSAGTTASTWRVVMGVRWVSSCGRWVPECVCSRAGSARTATGEATSSTPCRRISLPMCSRLPLECDEPLFTVAVTEVAYLQATRQKSRKRSRARARTG